jgi:hypothetical protein
MFGKRVSRSQPSWPSQAEIDAVLDRYGLLEGYREQQAWIARGRNSRASRG